MKTITAILIVLLTVHPMAASAQATLPGPDVWRTFTQELEVGTRIRLRFNDGRKVSATLVRADADALLIQPRTRVPVPVQPVPYDTIASIEREHPGLSGTKAAAIGVASGVATFFGILLIMVSTFD
jgi:hypothetical protein